MYKKYKRICLGPMVDINNLFKKYAKYRSITDKEKNSPLFKEWATMHFGKADEKTLAFRKRCKELGADVVFSTNMTDEQVIAFLEDEETQKILANPQKYSVI